MTTQRRFTREFKGEAVRLVTTSGRIQRKVADDLGVGLSTVGAIDQPSAGSAGGETR